MSDSNWSKIPAPAGYECVGYSNELKVGDKLLNALGCYDTVSQYMNGRYLRFVKKWQPKEGEVCYFWNDDVVESCYSMFLRMGIGGKYKDVRGGLWRGCRQLTSKEKGE